MKNRRKLALLCGLPGCLCYGGGDWLMMYGDPTHAGGLAFGGAGRADCEPLGAERFSIRNKKSYL